MRGRVDRRVIYIGIAFALVVAAVGTAAAVTRRSGDFGAGVALPSGVVAKDVTLDIQAYQPGVVRVPHDEVARSLVAISADEIELTFQRPPAALRDLQPDQVVLLEGYSLLRVAQVRTEGDQLLLDAGPAQRASPPLLAAPAAADV